MIELKDHDADGHTATAAGAEDNPDQFQDWHEDEGAEKQAAQKPWDTAAGKIVLAAGVAVPLLMTATFCAMCAERVVRVFMKQWLSSTVELAFVLMIPVANYLVWAAICRGDKRYAIRRGIMNGIAIGASGIIAGICAAAVFSGRVETIDSSLNSAFSFIGLVYLAALAAGIFVADKLRRAREVRSARMRTALYSFLGVLVALCGFAATETRAFCLKLAEQKVIAAPQGDRAAAIAQLRDLKPEFELRLECTDTRAAGISGMLFPVKSYTLRQLYFSATGKPFNDNKSEDLSGFSDDYVKRHVVGTAIDGLSLIRSELSGAVHPDTLSSTVDWTFVFKNTGDKAAEARAEIGLPPGAVIAGMTYWADGKARGAKFAASANASGHYKWVNITSTDPALVRDLGRGRALLHCYPVGAQDELKVRLNVVVPMKMQTPTECTLALPRLVDSNFSLEDENLLRLRSPMPLELKGIRSNSSADGMKMLLSSLKESDLKGGGLTVKVRRDSSTSPKKVPDSVSNGSYIAQSIHAVPTVTPSEVVIVLDGSASIASHFKGIKDALSQVPESIPAYLIVGRDDRSVGEPVKLKDALRSLTPEQFIGGQDNLQAICKAAESAGETRRGAVVWIHGPQSGLNKEIYILPENVAPSFYELALDSGSADSADFFKNHPEIGPFTPVPRNETSIDADLISFFKHMQPGSVDYAVNLASTGDRGGVTAAAKQQERELSALWAAQRCNALLRQDGYRACSTAVTYGIVTSLSSAVVLPECEANTGEMIGQAQASGGYVGPDRASEIATAPAIQGATNSTIGPDATYVTGLNTAGTVRVNNLANLEALLNVVANIIELLGILWGGVTVITAVIQWMSPAKPSTKQWLSPGGRFAVGLATVFFGVCTPGLINWLVASARDANLFN